MFNSKKMYYLSIAKNSIKKKKIDFGQDFLNSSFNILIYLFNASIEFRVRRRNITHKYGQLLTVDLNLARFRVTDWCRLKLASQALLNRELVSDVWR